MIPIYWLHFLSSHISREKTLELLVELWESKDPAHHSGGQEASESASETAECCQSRSSSNCLCTSSVEAEKAWAEGNLSPGAVGHRFLGLCLVSVQDLMATLSQNHIVSLQGRPFLDDSLLNWTITLKVRKLLINLVLFIGSSVDYLKNQILHNEVFCCLFLSKRKKPSYPLLFSNWNDDIKIRLKFGV